MEKKSIEEKIELKIAEIAPFLEQISGFAIIHNLNPSTVIFMTKNGLERLKISLPELREMGTEYYKRFFNPEDAADYVPKVLGMLERNNNKETISFFQQVRASAEDDWEWHVCGTRIFMQDDDGKPILTLSIAIPIDSKHFYSSKIERLSEENTFLRKNQHLYASLSKREQQILSLMAKDKSSIEIGEYLHLSEETVKTHRRNIKRKIGVQNQYDVIKFAQAFNIV